MTPEQKAAYIQAQTIEALIQALGMFFDNMQCYQNGETIAYNKEAFDDLGVWGSNSIIDFFRD